MTPPVLRSQREARAFAQGVRQSGRTLALVPTMGSLHQGHVSLMQEGARRADVVAVSIFVNPKQFGPQEDLSRYPRDLVSDLSRCEEAGIASVFAPDAAEMYPAGFQTSVEVAEVGRGLCGDRRPGHFKGVATVVTKLLALLRPQVALFGEKDYQQLQVIRALERDLSLGVEIVGMPTVREADGLAMSSRNSYLTPEERVRATSLWRGLSRAVERAAGGEVDAGALTAAVRAELASAAVREDYVELTDANTLKPLQRLEGPGRLLVAGFLGTTRLIDNVAIGPA